MNGTGRLPRDSLCPCHINRIQPADASTRARAKKGQPGSGCFPARGDPARLCSGANFRTQVLLGSEAVAQCKLHDARPRERVRVGAKAARGVNDRKSVGSIKAHGVRDVECLGAKRQPLPLRNAPSLAEGHVNPEITLSAEVIPLPSFSWEWETPIVIDEIGGGGCSALAAILAG